MVPLIPSYTVTFEATKRQVISQDCCTFLQGRCHCDTSFVRDFKHMVLKPITLAVNYKSVKLNNATVTEAQLSNSLNVIVRLWSGQLSNLLLFKGGSYATTC